MTFTDQGAQDLELEETVTLENEWQLSIIVSISIPCHDHDLTVSSTLVAVFTTHSWQPTILQDAELMQNVMQDHKNLHLAEYLILK